MVNIDLYHREDLKISDMDFLKAFKNQDETCFFRMIHDTKSISKNESSKLELTEDEFLYMRSTFNRYQKRGYGIFFVVQSGGQRKDSINKINAHFVDIDLHKSSSEDEIEKLKIDTLIELQKFPLDPSIIVETKNGFHIYWLLNPKINDIETYTYIQKHLIGHFRYADKATIDLSRVMRIPGYLHLKDPNNPFLIKCIWFKSNIRHSQEQFIQAIGLDIVKIKDALKKADKGLKIKNKDKVNVKDELDIDRLNLKDEVNVNYKPKVFYNYPDLIDYIKRQDLLLVLKGLTSILPEIQEGEIFNCIFHDDNNPSAKIWKTEKGYYKYKCFGDCSLNPRGEDIIDLVGRIKGYNFQQSLDYLINIFNIRFVETKWMDQQMKKYQQNLTFLFSKRLNDEYREKYPNFFKIMNRGKTLEIWEKIINIGMIHIHPSFIYNHESVIFFSNRYLTSLLRANSVGSINKYINLLATLGIIEKVKDKDVPESLLNRAYEEFKKDKNNKDIICFYVIYNIFDVIDEANIRAGTMLKTGFSIRSMGKKYLISVFGQEFADTIYDYQIESVYTDKKAKIIYDILIKELKKKRYFCYKDIEKKKILLCRKKNNQRIYIENWDKERLYKIVAAKVVNDYRDLEIKKQRLNKELKKHLNVKAKGYFDVYYISNNKKIL